MDQHATARGCSGAPTEVFHPGKRVEHLEKENKRGNEPAFRQAFATQLHHQRGEGRVFLPREPDQTAKNAGSKHNVGVDEQKIFRRLGRKFRRGDALRHSPDLPGPSRRAIFPNEHRHPPLCRAPRRPGRAIGV